MKKVLNSSYKSKLNKFLSILIDGYQFLRASILDPLLYSAFGYVSECKYEESCSHYAQRQLQEHATIAALAKIWRRVWSCHSF